MTELYRHYNNAGQLLYVGVSLSTIARLIEHKTTAPWFKQITRVTIERFPTRIAAERAEIIAIRDEQPQWNKAWNKYFTGEIKEAPIKEVLPNEGNKVCISCGDLFYPYCGFDYQKFCQPSCGTEYRKRQRLRCT